MRRAWAIETRLLSDCVDDQRPCDEMGRLAAAFYETRLNRTYQHTLKNLLLLQTLKVPNEMAMTVWPLPTMKIRRLSRHVFSATYTYFRKNPIPFSNTCLPRQPREMPDEPK